MEVIQHKYKQLEFKPNKESWIEQSYNMSMYQKCLAFVETEYNRHQQVDAIEEYNKSAESYQSTILKYRTRKTINSNTNPEKIIIYEILMMSGCCQEVSNRGLNKDLIWETLPKLVTDLKQLREQIQQNKFSNKFNSTNQRLSTHENNVHDADLDTEILEVFDCAENFEMNSGQEDHSINSNTGEKGVANIENDSYFDVQGNNCDDTDVVDDDIDITIGKANEIKLHKIVKVRINKNGESGILTPDLPAPDPCPLPIANSGRWG